MTLNAPLGQEFRFCNGHRAYNLREFLTVIMGLRQDEFAFHLNRDRNDFFNWVWYSLHERGLAFKLLHSRTKPECVVHISQFLRLKGVKG